MNSNGLGSNEGPCGNASTSAGIYGINGVSTVSAGQQMTLDLAGGDSDEVSDNAQSLH